MTHYYELLVNIEHCSKIIGFIYKIFAALYVDLHFCIGTTTEIFFG